MHPSPAFRHPDRAMLSELVMAAGFGMIFAATPAGPRVAHVPLLLADGRLRFHLARGNDLARHLDGGHALAVVNGPDGYVSARWYADPAQVPTWNYLAVEFEGPVRRLPDSALPQLLADLTARHEARIAQGTPWTMDKVPPDTLRALLGAITGFELEVRALRETVKLSQNKSPAERARLAEGLAANGAGAVAALMRQLVP